MSEIIRKFILILIQLFLVVQLHAQSFQFRNISTKEGLASSESYKVIQDRKGYIWISTESGLCKYNGKSIRVFTVDDGLPSNTIFEIMEDKLGRIWGGCFFGGVFYIKNDTVHTINANEELMSFGKETMEIIQKITIDSDSKLHIGTNQSYYQITPENNYQTIHQPFNLDSCFYYFKVIDQTVFNCRLRCNIPSSSPLSYIDSNDKRYKLNDVASFTNSTQNIGIRVQDSILYLAHGAFLTYWKNGHSKTIKCKGEILTLFEDQNNDLWVGFVDNGYEIYKKGDLTSIPLSGLGTNTISSICQDYEGGIWITTTHNGVYYCPNISLQQMDKLADQEIVGLNVADDNLFFGTYNECINRIQNDELKTVFQVKNSSRQTKAFFTSFKNQFWKAGGVLYLFSLDGKFEPVFVEGLGNKASGLQIMEKNDTLWGMTPFRLFKIVDKKIIYDGFLPARGFCFYNSSAGRFYVGCIDGLYEYENGKFTNLSKLMNDRPIRIASITEDENGRLIVASKNGGLFVREKSGWINITEKQGLSSNVCNHVLYSEKTQSIYVSTNKGISKISCNNFTEIEQVNMSNGLPTNEIVAVQEFEGKIYIATRRGLCYYRQDKMLYNTVSPLLSVIKLKLGDTNLLGNRKYDYDKNDLIFEGDVISYQDATRNKIKYRLFPVDSVFKYTSYDKLNYDNLAPGNYTFIVLAVNNSGTEGIPITYTFSINKPFWNEVWFILLSILVAILLIYVCIKYMTNRVRIREAEKSQLKQRIMEFHFTAIRAQMNPHFIFNVINSIQLFVLNNKPREAYNYLSKFSRLIRRVLDNSTKNLIPLSEELSMINSYMDLEEIRLENKLEFYIHIASDVNPSSILIPSMIIQPLLENAIWHGVFPVYKSRQAKIELSIYTDTTHKLIIKVRDNGLGFADKLRTDNKNNLGKSHGLKLVKDRLALLSQDSNVQMSNVMAPDNQIQGAEIIISLPLIVKNV